MPPRPRRSRRCRTHACHVYDRGAPRGWPPPGGGPLLPAGIRPVVRFLLPKTSSPAPYPALSPPYPYPYPFYPHRILGTTGTWGRERSESHRGAASTEKGLYASYVQAWGFSFWWGCGRRRSYTTPVLQKRGPSLKLPFSLKGRHPVGVCPRSASSREGYYVAALVALRRGTQGVTAAAGSEATLGSAGRLEQDSASSRSEQTGGATRGRRRSCRRGRSRLPAGRAPGRPAGAGWEESALGGRDRPTAQVVSAPTSVIIAGAEKAGLSRLTSRSLRARKNPLDAPRRWSGSPWCAMLSLAPAFPRSSAPLGDHARPRPVSSFLSGFVKS